LGFSVEIAARASGHFVRFHFFLIQMFGHFVRTRALQHDDFPCENDRKSIKTRNGMAIAAIPV